MRLIYTPLLYMMLPFVLLRLLWRSSKSPEYGKRWGERMGFLSGKPAPGGVWIHAVSVGEVQAIEPLVKHLQQHWPALSLTITTSTPTGSERVRLLFGQDVFHVYYPYDLPAAVRCFLDRIQPRLLVMVETEIWPNMLRLCRERQVPTLLANGRLSARSARRYGYLRKFSRRVFGMIDGVAAQSEADARRFIDLGVPRERVRVTGSIKFDMRIPARVQEQTQVVRRVWGDRPVWVAASTHEGEEELVLAAHRKILAQIPSALLVLVPRHPERFERVAMLVQRLGFSLLRRSSERACDQQTQVFLGDTMGELPVFLGVADVAFIGGSLVKVGGHNMLEAAAQGVPVLFGPHVFNFSAIARLLRDQGAGILVQDIEELSEQVAAWLQDASERSRVGEHGRQAVEQNRGALQHLVNMVDGFLQEDRGAPVSSAQNEKREG